MDVLHLFFCENTEICFEVEIVRVNCLLNDWQYGVCSNKLNSLMDMYASNGKILNEL